MSEALEQRQTMEQRRAANAWECCEGCSEAYRNLVKSAPALIMNSGLMQTVAFLQDKGKEKPDGPHHTLNCQLRTWLTGQFDGVLPKSDKYEDFMKGLLEAEPRLFQEITAEAMAWLRWVRQIAPTRVAKEG